MKYNVFASLVVGLAIALSTTTALSQPRQTQRARFFCQNSQGVPITVARTTRGNITRDIPIFRWVTRLRDFTPLERCETVSRRFQAFYDNGILNNIRTGQVNGYPVLCAARQKGGNCRSTDILVTLPRGSNPSELLSQMLDRGVYSGRGPINLSGSNLIFYDNGETYINMDTLLNSDPVEGETN
ncbi:COP23 domain-containing protein [Aerosakkonema funiforme]|uniref:COP23 domain-containing protein n=1 Tax=Aerosakkonema funiforme TaxID=1246630 RepID=UPI0035B92656